MSAEGRSSTPTERTEMNVVSRWVHAMPCTIISLCLTALASLLLAVLGLTFAATLVSLVGTATAFFIALVLDRP